MMRTNVWTYLFWVGFVFPAASGELKQQTYRDLCEASTAVSIDGTSSIKHTSLVR